MDRQSDLSAYYKSQKEAKKSVASAQAAGDHVEILRTANEELQKVEQNAFFSRI